MMLDNKPNVKDCYLSLMLIHEMFTPINNYFKDYIAKPKTNMYKSIHTTVFGPDNRLIQFQIRTQEMEKIAIYGLTSYWFKYKNNARINMQKDLENNFQFFKSIKELDSTILDNIEFVSLIKKELLLYQQYSSYSYLIKYIIIFCKIKSVNSIYNQCQYIDLY